MTRLIIDSSYFVALALPSDPHHLIARNLFKQVFNRGSRPCTTQDFIKETLTIISQRAGRSVAIDFRRLVGMTTQVIPVTDEYYQAGLDKFLNPRLNKNISLIDCIGAAIYEDIRADAIASFDADFKLLGLKVI